MQQAIVYEQAFQRYETGDLVKCCDCGKNMLLEIGDTECKECGSSNLQWYDSDRPEWTKNGLEECGFNVIEK